MALAMDPRHLLCQVSRITTTRREFGRPPRHLVKSAVTFLDGAARCARARQDKLVSRPVAAGRSPRSPAALIALRAALTLTQSECSTYKKYLDQVDVVLVNCPMLARTSHPSPFRPIPSIQPPHYHAITYSFAQRQPSIPSIFNSFRTLSNATEVVPPSLSKSRGVSSLWSLRSDLSALCVALLPASARRHMRHVAPLSPVDSLDCAYFPSPRGCPRNPAIFSACQLSDTILSLCLRRQSATAQPN